VQMIPESNKENTKTREELKIQNKRKKIASRISKRYPRNIGKGSDGWEHSSSRFGAGRNRSLVWRIVKEIARARVTIQFPSNEDRRPPGHESKEDRHKEPTNPSGALEHERKSQYSNALEVITYNQYI
jgi:hypothetical protein